MSPLMSIPGKENAPRRTANILFLPAHCHSYFVTYRIETVNLTKPAGNILVNPAQNSCHFLMDFLHAVQIPADGLIMKYPVAESTERIQRGRDILPLTVLLGHERERPAQVFPQQTLIFAVQQGNPKSKRQFCNNLRWSDTFMPSRYLFAGLGNIVIQPCQTGSGREYSIPVLPACHGLQFTAQGIAQCYLKHRKTCVERLCQFKVTPVMKYRTGLSKKGLLYSIFFVLLLRSPGRSSPSFQLLVMNPGFFMSCCKGKQTFPDGVTTSVNNCRTGTEMPDGYFLKQWCRLWEITPDSQQLTNHTAHLACFKHGQMCITLTQRTDIQRYLHQHCTTPHV